MRTPSYMVETPIEHVGVSAYTIPTDFPESDGTLQWKATTLVLVELTAGDQQGIGYTYADTATARLIHDTLGEIVRGRTAMDVPGAWQAMVNAIPNLGRPGIASMAIKDRSLLVIRASLARRRTHFKRLCRPITKRIPPCIP